MEQHYQIVNLHNIIKSQEAKIHQLRQELKIANEREEQRYGQFSQNSQIQLDEKDNMIVFLKEELAKTQQGRTDQLNTERGRHQMDLEKIEINLMNSKKKNIQLEGKLRRIQSENHGILMEVMEKVAKAEAQLKKQQQSKTKLTSQISQLSHFYKNSLFSIARRKETLLWVDKFTEYLETSELKEKKILNDIHSFVTNQINNLRTNLATLVGDIAKSQEQIHSDKKTAERQIGQMLEQIRKQCNEILGENEKYWSTAIKNEKSSESSEEVKRLNIELTNMKELFEKQREQMMKRMKDYQNEKKTLILGFQELRSLAENKQNYYKKQVKVLKQTIQQLIGCGQKRDKQFQEQIKLLSSQIEHISERYYDNIDFPLKKFNDRIGGSLEMVKAELEELHKNPNLKKSMNNFQEIMGSYIQKMEEQSKTNLEVESYMSHSNEIIQNIMKIMQETKEIHDQYKSNESPHKSYGQQDSLNGYNRHPHVSPLTVSPKTKRKIFQDKNNSKLPQYIPINSNNKSQLDKQTAKDEMFELTLIDLREKSNKCQYELILNKKHLTKMQEHCAQLQKKSNLRSNQKQMSRKIMQLEAENEALKETYGLEQESHQENINSLKNKLNSNQMQVQSLRNYHHLLNSAVTRIQQSNSIVEQFIKEEKEHFLEMKENMKNIQTLLIRPMESFQILVKQFMEMSRHGDSSSFSASNNNPRGSIFMGLSTQRKSPYNNDSHTFHPSPEKQQAFFTKNVVSSEQIQNYKQILSKKQQNNIQTQRLLSELIKTLRESHKQFSLFNTQKNPENAAESHNKALHEKNTRNTNNNMSRAIDKKIRDMQAQRLKDRQEALLKVEKLSENLDKIDKKIQKQTNLKSTLNKFEANLNCRIDEIVQKMQVKLEKSQINVIKQDVIKDLRSKLGQSNLESEGLRKQLSLATSARLSQN